MVDSRDDKVEGEERIDVNHHLCKTIGQISK